MVAHHIHADYLKTVAFLFVKKSSKSKPEFGGTAFFLEMTLPDEKSHVCYIVTCFHVIQSAKQKGDLFLRINSGDGTSRDHPVPYEKWAICEKTDLAIAKLDIDLESEAYRAIHFEWMIAEDRLKRGLVPAYGIGSEVFYVGLFRGIESNRRNYPVARFGSIALMPPEEKIPLREKIAIDAYLIETHTWQGFSGSPVFLYPPVHHGEFSPWKEFLSEYSVIFLGVLHAHFPIEAEVRHEEKTLGKLNLRSTIDLNSGLAIVNRAQQLHDFLMSEEMQMDRKKISEKIEQSKPLPILDSSLLARSVVEAAIGEPLTPTKGKPKKQSKKASRRAPR